MDADARADIHTVAQLLGHKDLRMAMRYQHLSPGFLAEAVARLDGVFGDTLLALPGAVATEPSSVTGGAISAPRVTTASPGMANAPGAAA